MVDVLYFKIMLLSIVSNRQQLRESSEELKTLEAQLRAAYVSKELAAQIAEKKAAAIQEKVSFNYFNTL